MRMAKVAIGGGRWQKEVRGYVKHFFWVKSIEEQLDSITNWDGGCGELYLCDEVSDFLWNEQLQREHEDRHGNFEAVESNVGGAVSCCIRAGFDVAVGMSARSMSYQMIRPCGCEGEMP